METAEFIEALKTDTGYFIQHNGKADWREGWKLSIQGKTLEDSAYLYDHLITLLVGTQASFKFATQKLFDYGGEQATKALTIYIPNGVDARSFAELVKINIPDYKGAEGIEEKKSYTKYSEGIFYRNDRTETGAYIPA